MKRLEKGGVALADIEFFAHGTTVVINAITERRGVRVGLVTTRAFATCSRSPAAIGPICSISISGSRRRSSSGICGQRYASVATTRARCGARCRSGALAGADRYFSAEGCRRSPSAFCMPTAIPRTRAPSRDADAGAVARSLGAWHRTSSVASGVNTSAPARRCCPPTCIRSRSATSSRSSGAGRAGLRRPPLHHAVERRHRHHCEAARRNPIAMVESGPASGVLCGSASGQCASASNNLIALDIGGTTAKCALIDDGEVQDHHGLLRSSAPAESRLSHSDAGLRDRRDRQRRRQHRLGRCGRQAARGAAKRRGTCRARSPTAAAEPRRPPRTPICCSGGSTPRSFGGGEIEPDWDGRHRAFDGSRPARRHGRGGGPRGHPDRQRQHGQCPAAGVNEQGATIRANSR